VCSDSLTKPLSTREEARASAIANLSSTTPGEPIRQKIFDEINNIFAKTVDTGDKISERTIEEKKTATQAYTNKLVDSTSYVSKKETEKLREFYNKRLAIVSVNPDYEELFK
jgi:phage-related tail protein